MLTIRMETELVQRISRELEQANSAIIESLNGLQSQVRYMEWEGQSAEHFRAEFDRLNRQILSVCEEGNVLWQRMRREAQEWLAVDGQGVNRAQQAGKSLAALHLTMAGGGVSLAGASQVLGLSTTSSSQQYVSEYQQMSWNKKLQAEKNLEAEIATRAKKLAEMRSAEEIQNDLASLDKQIAELEKKKAEAQAQADKWYNKILPDTPLTRDSDGAPWRVRTDDFEDEAADYDRQIRALEMQKQALRAELSARQEEAARVADLQSRRAALSEVIGDGMQKDGPSKWHDYFSGTDSTNCTKYAASQRDVPCRGDAYKWNEQAEAGGFETGIRPVKGSVLVIEPDPAGKQSHATKGHVAIVESVTDLGNGKYSIHISEGNWGGKYNERDITISTGTTSAKVGGVPVSFIYGKRK